MSPKYKRNALKRIQIKATFQDGQYVNIYSPDREGWNPIPADIAQKLGIEPVNQN